MPGLMDRDEVKWNDARFHCLDCLQYPLFSYSNLGAGDEIKFFFHTIIKIPKQLNGNYITFHFISLYSIPLIIR